MIKFKPGYDYNQDLRISTKDRKVFLVKLKSPKQLADEFGFSNMEHRPSEHHTFYDGNYWTINTDMSMLLGKCIQVVEMNEEERKTHEGYTHRNVRMLIGTRLMANWYWNEKWFEMELISEDEFKV